MYRAEPDPYRYAGTAVLKNIPGIREPVLLERFEAAMTAERASEPLPGGGLGVRHYQAVHRHLFQDVYRWAGRFRTVRIAKDHSMFCYPENIPEQIRRLFDLLSSKRHLRELDSVGFSREGAHFLAELNAIHPFRDGNGRTQLAFLALLAARAGHPLDFARLDPQPFLRAMIASFNGDERPLSRAIRSLIRNNA